jgi:hypothetical protein
MPSASHCRYTRRAWLQLVHFLSEKSLFREQALTVICLDLTCSEALR